MKKESRSTSELDSDTLIEKQDTSKKESHPNSEAKTRTSELKTQKEAAVNTPAPEGARSRGQAARGAVGAQIHRATTLARDVEGDVIYRARKMREMSNIVWDEAGDDPNLRFVLVAAVLFLLFLVIVVLNRVIT